VDSRRVRKGGKNPTGRFLAEEVLSERKYFKKRGMTGWRREGACHSEGEKVGHLGECRIPYIGRGQR